jgi:hypothetical protein
LKPLGAQNYPTPHLASDWQETGFIVTRVSQNLSKLYPKFDQRFLETLTTRNALIPVFPKILERKIDRQKKVKNWRFLNFDAESPNLLFSTSKSHI